MAASLRARFAADLPAGGLYFWTEDQDPEPRWLLFSPADGTFTACDGAGATPAAAMTLSFESQDLRNRDEDWVAFVQVAHGIWKAFQRDGQHPRSVDRTFH